MRAKVLLPLAVLALVVSAVPALVAAETGDLGSVRIREKVLANGEPLAPGTYTVRLSDAAVTPVVGESPDSSKWVEFVQAGQVKGRELASVVAPADVKQVAHAAPPATGTARVQLLRGAGYVRVWINHGGTQYLVHLATAK